MRSTFLVALAALLLAVTSPVRAAALIGDTKVPFSAARSVMTGGKTYDGMVYAEPGKQRHEQNLGGLPMIAILRADLQVAWVILPGLHVYAEFPFPKAVTDFDGVAALGPPVGSDKVSGLASARYRIEHDGDDGSALDGWVWMTGDGIITKLEGEYSTAKNKHVKASYVLTDIKLGPQDPGLFELPPGAKKMPVEMIQGLFSLQRLNK
jgi:hypothetical protein